MENRAHNLSGTAPTANEKTFCENMSDRIAQKIGCLLKLHSLATSYSGGLPMVSVAFVLFFRKLFEKLW